jgi:hypothetical protein
VKAAGASEAAMDARRSSRNGPSTGADATRSAASAPDLSDAAAALLRTRFGARVTLHDGTLLKDWERNVVLRYRVADADVRSVIVKWMKEAGALGFSEWASLAYLSRTDGAAALAPHFYGGDEGSRIFAMEDLGGSESVDDLLRRPDRPAAERALGALAAQTGRLHAATLGDDARYRRMRQALPGSREVGRRGEAARWLAGRPALRRWLDALDVAEPAGFGEALGRIAALYRAPGPFLAFTHGDPAPTNNHVADGQVRLLDFEYGGFRHALYDITAWYVLCPLPERVARMMSDRYRAELAGECSAARDEDRYRGAWAAMCAYRAQAVLTWLPIDLLQRDHPWVEDWTGREAVLSTLARLQAATSGVRALAPLATTAGRMEDALRARWPAFGEGDDLLPRWPALGEAMSEE